MTYMCIKSHSGVDQEKIKHLQEPPSHHSTAISGTHTGNYRQTHTGDTTVAIPEVVYWGEEIVEWLANREPI